MDLKTWRLKEGKTQIVTAELLGVTQAYYSKLELGRRRASPALALVIKEHTRGKVTPKDLGVKE